MTIQVFHIVDVTPASAPDVRRLIDEASVAASSFRGAQRLRASCARLDLSSARGAIGTYEDRVVGLALWTIDDAELMIEVLYVVPEARGLGLGESLVQRAVEETRRHGCMSIAGRALPGDRETKNVYERTGLVSQVITVGKALD